MHSLEHIKSLVKKKLEDHPDRYQHILGVAKMATYLAQAYGVDIEKAEIAAYMHDFSKYDREEEQQKVLNPTDIKECKQYPVLYHSYASAEYYLKLIGDDKDIYNAIRNHVFGRLGMTKLEEIILISDYTEENRKYENCIKCREILLGGNLNKAIYDSTKYTIEFIQSKGITPHPLQLEVLNYYKELCNQ